MTGAVQAASPAAPAAGNATLLSAQPDPAPDPTPPVDPGAPPADPVPGDGTESPPADPPVEGEEPKEGDAGAPESYEFVAPEGITLDTAAVEAFSPIAKDLKLTQSQAQRLVDVYAGLQAQQAEAQAAQVQEWAKQVITDKEIGGPKWAANALLVREAKDRFASQELLDLMDSTGLGNHPAVIKHFIQVGKQFADDGHVTGSGHATQPTDAATEYFARMPKKERVS